MKIPSLNAQANPDNQSLDRRELILAGVALAMTAMAPMVAFAAPGRTVEAMPRRKLGALEVSAIGLGCMT